MIDEDLQGLLNKAYFYLKFRPRTIWEMRRYLYKKIEKTHWSRADADKVINYLIKQELLNDKKFIEIFVDERSLLKPKGEFVLKQELLRHGIEKNLIDEYFSTHSVNEEELAAKVLAHRWLRFKNLSREKRWQKASQFLLRRGFGFNLVRKIIKKLEGRE